MSSHPFFKDQLIRPEPPPQPELSSFQPQPHALPPLPAILQTSKPIISPVVGFAVGVAGLAAAAVAYYQLAQFVAKRNAETPPSAVTATVQRGEGENLPATADSSNTQAAGRAGQAARSGASAAGTPRTGQSRPSSAPVRASAGASAAAAPAASGTINIDSPVSFEVYVGGQLRGVSTDGSLTLPAGTRTVTLVNTQLEFRQTVPVAVQAGQGVRLAVPLPTGSLSVNALPWAEVWVDGKPVGTTPLANLALPIGSHDIVWRHPTLGERRQTIIVKTQTPARVGVDFNR